VQTIEVLDNSTFTPEGKGEIFYKTSFGGKIKKTEPLKVSQTGLNLPFEYLNPLQTLFYKFYKGGNALVSAPTSAGKTGIALIFFHNRRGRLVYTAPTKALVTEKAAILLITLRMLAAVILLPNNIVS
jgi:helicase